MSKIRNIVGVWKVVFGNWRYLLLGVLIALVFYELNVIIANFSNLTSFFNTLGFLGSLKFLFNVSIGFSSVLPTRSLSAMVILGILTGMLISLLVYKARLIRDSKSTKTGFLAGVGVFLGVLVPGCASCGVGLAAVLGLGASLAVLPLQGLEIAVLGAGILAFSIVKVSAGFLECEACKHIGK